MLEVIYYVGVAALGFLFGLITEVAIDAGLVRDLKAENRRLTFENQQLRREARHEVVEIIDNRRQPEDNDFFKPF